MPDIHLTEDEALVLFDWIGAAADACEDRAAQVALWSVECALEKALDAPFRPDCPDLIQAARARLLEGRD